MFKFASKLVSRMTRALTQPIIGLRIPLVNSDDSRKMKSIYFKLPLLNLTKGFGLPINEKSQKLNERALLYNDDVALNIQEEVNIDEILEKAKKFNNLITSKMSNERVEKCDVATFKILQRYTSYKPKTILQYALKDVKVICVINAEDRVAIQKKLQKFLQTCKVCTDAVMTEFEAVAEIDVYKKLHEDALKNDKKTNEKLLKEATMRVGAVAADALNPKGLLRFKCEALKTASVEEALKSCGYTLLNMRYTISPKNCIEVTAELKLLYQRFEKYLLNIEGVEEVFNNLV